MATWNDEKVFKLIDLWGEDSIQVQMGLRENCHSNERSWLWQISREYRKVKDKQGKTGTGGVTWKIFNVLDDLLGTRPSTKPAVMVDYLRDSEDEITDTTPETETSVNEGNTKTEAPAD